MRRPEYLPRRAARGKRAGREHSLRAQFKRHSVALVSLLVALSSLAYNTWRNETSELHRNWRQGAFQVMTDVSQVRRIILYRRYFHGRQDHPLTPLQHAETWVAGWTRVAAVRDLTSILPDPLPAHGEDLHEAWEAHAGDLDAEDAERARKAETILLEEVDELRAAILELIDRLR